MRLDVRLEHESIWLTQKQMAELFGRDQSVISRHIHRALADDELSPESIMQKVHIASSDKPVVLYSLDADVYESLVDEVAAVRDIRTAEQQLDAGMGIPHEVVEKRLRDKYLK